MGNDHRNEEQDRAAAFSATRSASAPRQAKKKLLYLAICDPDLEVTGATVRMGAFVSHLARYYDVTLVNMAGSGHRVTPGIEERFRDRNNRLGVSRRVRIDFSRPGYFLISPALYREADRFLRREPFHYLLADYGLAAVYGKIFSARYGIPLIYSSHNVEYRMYIDVSKYDLRRRVMAPYVYWAERAACRAANLVITISERDRTQYAKWIPADRIEVIPQGFDPKLANPFYEPPAKAPPVVLFVGSFRSENNRLAARRIVQEIAPAVLQTRADVNFQLIGADPPSDVKGTNIDCPGFVDDLSPYMNRANLVIAPMPFAQGMATKIVSALAFGKTVLSTPEAASGITSKYRQLEVAPLAAFPAKVVELLTARPAVDTSEFQALCDEFAWSNLMARLYARIEACCARSNPGRSLQPQLCRGTSWQ
jgi:Glycosyltransferase Family 4/Glycosyl transferases group 1